MTKRRPKITRHKQVEEYIRTSLLAPMGLAHWTIVVDPEPCGPKHAATISPGPGNYEAVMRLGAEYFSDPPEEQRDTTVHELTHLWHWPVLDILRVRRGRSIADRRLGPDLTAHVDETGAIVGIALAAASTVDIPTWAHAVRTHGIPEDIDAEVVAWMKRRAECSRGAG